jgi:hypothetical protein
MYEHVMRRPMTGSLHWIMTPWGSHWLPPSPGCFALTCRNCGCDFCARCLADCGTDAHKHCAKVGDGRGASYPSSVSQKASRLASPTR